MIRIILLLLICSNTFGQINDIDFLTNKIKTEYAGYPEKVKNFDFDNFAAKTVQQNKLDTFKAMGIIVDFFKDRHLNLIHIKADILTDTVECQNNLVKVERYFNDDIKKNKREGYWLNDYNNCVMAICRVGDDYEGYVVESLDSTILYPGTKAYYYECISQNNYFTRFTSDYSGDIFFLSSTFRNDSTLITGASGKWKKLNNYNHSLIKTLPVFSDKATCRLLDSTTFLITIPISTEENAMIVDSIVKASYSLITSTKNLIIDIRQNMGGKSKTFQSLLPLAYTKPITKINGETLCSKGLVEQDKEDIAEYIKNGNIDSSFLKNQHALVEIEEDSIGKFLSWPADSIRYDTILPYPKNIGIIINYACQSAAEMMLLNCMQSDKVTLFGEHTMGAIDYLNMYPASFPSKKYMLRIATTRRVIPARASKLDGVGIYPNVEIKDSEPDWIGFVKKYYKNH